MRPRLLLVPAAALTGISCFGGLPGDADDWHDQLVAESPCYEVDLMDGLQETETTEVGNLFDCLNHHRHIDALQPLRDGFDDATRSGDPVGIELARMVNHMGDVDVDVFRVAEVGIDLLAAPDRPIEEFLDVGLELTYGRPAHEVRDPGFVLTSYATLSEGALSPLEPVLPQVCGALLDDDLDAVVRVGQNIASDDVRDTLHTVNALASSSDGRVTAVTDDLLPHLGELILQTRSPSNDRWSGSSGDSLRDLLDHALYGTDPQLGDMQPTAEDMLEDPTIRAALRVLLIELHASGELRDVPAGLAWMASVDNQGDTLQSGELSALASFVRLLSEANEPMTCSINLGLGTLSVNLPNMSTTLLSVLADQDPYDVQDLTGILSDVLDFGLTEWMLDLIADSDNCNVLDQDMLDDLQVLDVLQEAEAEPVLVLFVELFDTYKNDGQVDHLDDFADFARALHRSQTMSPLEELLRDIGNEPGTADLIDLVDVLARPNAHGITVPSGNPTDLRDGLDALYWVVHDDGGQTGWQQTGAIADAALKHDGTWQSVGNLATVMARPDSQLSQSLQLIPPLVDVDPELTLLDELGPLLSDRELAAPLLRMCEQPAVASALLSATPQGDNPEVPQAFAARLVRDGTVDDLLRLIDVLLKELEGVE